MESAKGLGFIGSLEHMRYKKSKHPQQPYSLSAPFFFFKLKRFLIMSIADSFYVLKIKFFLYF